MLREFDLQYEHDLAIEKIRERDAAEDIVEEDTKEERKKSSLFSSFGTHTECPAYSGLCSLFKATRGENWKNRKRWDASPDGTAPIHILSPRTSPSS